MSVTPPTDQQALEFALILRSGLPPAEAITYFVESDDPALLGAYMRRWVRSKAFRAAQRELDGGKAWQDLSTDEMLHKALDLHYRQLAYMLSSRNYTEADHVEKGKLDSARQALESKIAGTAGKTDSLTRFLDDFAKGKLEGRVKPGWVAPALAH